MTPAASADYPRTFPRDYGIYQWQYGKKDRMGFYIETPLNTKKALQLENYGAVLYSGSFSDVPSGKTLICVIENPLFDAAGIVYDIQQYEDFTEPDDLRPKRFLLIDTYIAANLCPQYNNYLIRDSE